MLIDLFFCQFFWLWGFYQPDPAKSAGLFCGSHDGLSILTVCQHRWPGLLLLNCSDLISSMVVENIQCTIILGEVKLVLDTFKQFELSNTVRPHVSAMLSKHLLLMGSADGGCFFSSDAGSRGSLLLVSPKKRKEMRPCAKWTVAAWCCLYAVPLQALNFHGINLARLHALETHVSYQMGLSWLMHVANLSLLGRKWSWKFAPPRSRRFQR